MEHLEQHGADYNKRFIDATCIRGLKPKWGLCKVPGCSAQPQPGPTYSGRLGSTNGDRFCVVHFALEVSKWNNGYVCQCNTCKTTLRRSAPTESTMSFSVLPGQASAPSGLAPASSSANPIPPPVRNGATMQSSSVGPRFVQPQTQWPMPTMSSSVLPWSPLAACSSRPLALAPCATSRASERNVEKPRAAEAERAVNAYLQRVKELNRVKESIRDEMIEKFRHWVTDSLHMDWNGRPINVNTTIRKAFDNGLIKFEPFGSLMTGWTHDWSDIDLVLCITNEATRACLYQQLLLQRILEVAELRGFVCRDTIDSKYTVTLLVDEMAKLRSWNDNASGGPSSQQIDLHVSGSRT